MTSIITDIRSTIVAIAEVSFKNYIDVRVKTDGVDANDIVTLSYLYCNNHGNYISPNTCDCDMGFFGKYCEFNGYSLWGRGWTFLQVFVAFVYSIIAIMTWIYFKRIFTLVTIALI
jgi:hypothetical protein